MATGNAQDLTKTFGEVLYDIGKIEKSSKNIAQNFDQLLNQIRRVRPISITQLIAGGPKLPAWAKMISSAVITSVDEIDGRIKLLNEGIVVAGSKIREFQEAIDDYGPSDEAFEYVRIEAKLIEEYKAGLYFLEKQTRAKELAARFTGEKMSWEYAFIQGLVHSVKLSGQMNQALVEANTLARERYEINDKIWRVMAKTGHTNEGMLEASRALVGVGGDLRSSFEDTLETMVQMKDGLGVP